MKNLKDLKDIIAAKKIDFTESLMLNAEYEHQIKNIKGKPINKEENQEFSKCNDLKKGNTKSKNIETQTLPGLQRKKFKNKSIQKQNIFLKLKKGGSSAKNVTKYFH